MVGVLRIELSSDAPHAPILPVNYTPSMRILTEGRQILKKLSDLDDFEAKFAHQENQTINRKHLSVRIFLTTELFDGPLPLFQLSFLQFPL